MKSHSNKNTYSTTDGHRLTRDQIERNVRKAKAQKVEEQLYCDGYNYCEKCGKNASTGPLDCSHTTSVKECLETGQAELSFSLSNIKILCRTCHQQHDGLNIFS